jgi:hypothetical protein
MVVTIRVLALSMVSVVVMEPSVLTVQTIKMNYLIVTVYVYYNYQTELLE